MNHFIMIQVSWHWKSVVELDQLWMPKCLKLGWMLTFSPSLHETGMWKRLYIENMVALKNSCRHVSKPCFQKIASVGEITCKNVSHYQL